jgi:nicotinic acid phosphoribosyltransferase
MREGYYTDAYFNHTRAALLADGRHPRVVMQVFQKHRPCSEGWTRRSRSSSSARTNGMR